MSVTSTLRIFISPISGPRTVNVSSEPGLNENGGS